MIDADRYWNEKEEELMKMPVCSECGEHIQDEECIELLDGKILCNECESDLAHDLWFEWGREMYAVNTRGLVGIE